MRAWRVAMSGIFEGMASWISGDMLSRMLSVVVVGCWYGIMVACIAGKDDDGYKYFRKPVDYQHFLGECQRGERLSHRLNHFYFVLLTIQHSSIIGLSN